jgi:hypothetical protein
VAQEVRPTGHVGKSKSDRRVGVLVHDYDAEFLVLRRRVYSLRVGVGGFEIYLYGVGSEMHSESTQHAIVGPLFT